MFFVKCKLLKHLGHCNLNTSKVSVTTYIGSEKEFYVKSNRILNDCLLEIDSFVETGSKIKVFIGFNDLYVKKNQIVRMYDFNINLKIAEKETN
jgi:hypothetical protein